MTRPAGAAGRAAGVLVAVLLGAAGCGEDISRAMAAPEPVAPIVAGSAGLEAYLDCLDDERITLLSAHRGGPAPGFPENAIATFAHTLAHAAATLEIDVAQTRDGALVLMHDDRLERTTTCTGAVADRTVAELADCRLRDDDGARTDFAIPTLERALAWADGRTVLWLDIKDSVEPSKVVDAVRRAHAEDRVILITYDAEAAARIHRLASDIVISASVYDTSDVAELEARGVPLDEIVAWTGTRDTEPAFYAALDAEDVPVAFGTLGDPATSVDGEIARSGEEGRYRRIAAEGVDVISTDRPVEAYEALREDRDPALALYACRSAS